MPARNKAYKRCKSTLQLLERKVRAWYESSPYWLLTFTLLYDDIFGIKVAFRRDKLRRHSATMPTKCVVPHMTWEQRVMQSYAYNAPDTQHALYSANNYATTIRYSLYNAPLLPGRFQIAGAKNATQQIWNRLGASTRKVSSSDGIAQLRRTREKNALYYIKQRPLTVEADTW